LYRGRTGKPENLIGGYMKKITVTILVMFVFSMSVYSSEVEEYLNAGNEKNKAGDYAGAIKDCNKAIELDPKYAAAYNNRGLYKEESGDFKDAIKDLDRAIELDPELSPAYYNRGNAKSGSDDRKGAVEDFNRAIELNPEYA
jgi:tetratricopeptide (TPR) repeat protein